MAIFRSLLTLLLGVLLFFLGVADALKFDLQANPHHNTKNERCIRNCVAKETLVVVTATVSGYRGDGQMVNIHVCNMHWVGNMLLRCLLTRLMCRLGIRLEMNMGGQEM